MHSLRKKEVFALTTKVSGFGNEVRDHSDLELLSLSVAHNPQTTDKRSGSSYAFRPLARVLERRVSGNESFGVLGPVSIFPAFCLNGPERAQPT